MSKDWLDYGEDRVKMIRQNIETCTERAVRQKAEIERREITPKEKREIESKFSDAIREHDRMRNIKRGVK